MIGRRRKSQSVIQTHTQLLVSKTWQKVLKERQQQQDVEEFNQTRKCVTHEAYQCLRSLDTLGCGHILRIIARKDTHGCAEKDCC